MPEFAVRITLAGGSFGRHRGTYANGAEAVEVALGHFPQAKGVSAMCVRAHTPRTPTLFTHTPAAQAAERTPV